MIKHSDKLLLWELSCDSCHKIIADCMAFEWKEGQELIYAPLLCESCGKKHNKDIGDDVFRLTKLEKYMKDNMIHIEGYERKYYKEDEE